MANLRYAFFNLNGFISRAQPADCHHSLYFSGIRGDTQGIVQNGILDHVYVVYDVAKT